jgi:hypothetical protein
MMPDVLMIRSGLTVSARQLRAARALIQVLRPGATWGMSPFGGAARDPVWAGINARQFLRAGCPASALQAALRVATLLDARTPAREPAGGLPGAPGR